MYNKIRKKKKNKGGAAIDFLFRSFSLLALRTTQGAEEVLVVEEANMNSSLPSSFNLSIIVFRPSDLHANELDNAQNIFRSGRVEVGVNKANNSKILDSDLSTNRTRNHAPVKYLLPEKCIATNSTGPLV